jgi:hypothetical protein
MQLQSPQRSKGRIVVQAFLDWLVSDFDIYGLPVQHWMLVSASMLAMFAVVIWQDHHKSP